MQKICAFALAALLLLTGCGAGRPDKPAGDEGKLHVYTSIYPLYDFAGKIGGEHIALENLIPAGGEPHDWEPSSADMMKLADADLFLYNGAGLEHWVGPALQAVGGEPFTAVDMASRVEGLLAGDEGTDPHIWLSISLAREQLRIIAELLCELDGDNAEYYRENCDHWTEAFDALDREFRDALSPHEGRDVVVAHAAYGYLFADYGLNQVAVQGFSPEGEPDPADMARIIDYAREHPVKVIFFEELASSKVADAIAREVGAEVSVLNPLEGLTQEQMQAGEDYLSVMRQNLERLLYALS